MRCVLKSCTLLVNFKISNCFQGTFLVQQNLVKCLVANESPGAIVNISSIVAKHGNIGQSNYAASKAGVEAFTKTTAKELGK